VVHTDGVFDRGADGALRFFRAVPPTEDIEGLVVEIALACERWLARRCFAGAVEGGWSRRTGKDAARDRSPPPARFAGPSS
jgi:hypothetical protein